MHGEQFVPMGAIGGFPLRLAHKLPLPYPPRMPGVANSRKLEDQSPIGLTGFGAKRLVAIVTVDVTVV